MADEAGTTLFPKEIFPLSAPAEKEPEAKVAKDKEIPLEEQGPQPWPQGPDYDPREDPGPPRPEDAPAEDQ